MLVLLLLVGADAGAGSGASAGTGVAAAVVVDAVRNGCCLRTLCACLALRLTIIVATDSRVLQTFLEIVQVLLRSMSDFPLFPLVGVDILFLLVFLVAEVVLS